MAKPPRFYTSPAGMRRWRQCHECRLLTAHRVSSRSCNGWSRAPLRRRRQPSRTKRSALPPHTLPGCPTGPACRCLRPRLGWLPSRVCTYLARLPKKYGRWCVVPVAHDLWTGRLQGDNLVSHILFLAELSHTQTRTPNSHTRNCSQFIIAYVRVGR